MNKEDKIEQLIKKGLYNYEIKPEGEVWSHISSSLDQINRAQKRHILYKRISICSAAAILLIFAVISIVPNKKIDNIAKIDDNIIQSVAIKNIDAIGGSRVDNKSTNNTLSATNNNPQYNIENQANTTNNNKAEKPANNSNTETSVSNSNTETVANNSNTETSAGNSSTKASANNNTINNHTSKVSDNKEVDNKKAETSVSNSNTETVANNSNTETSAGNSNTKASANNNINVIISKKPIRLATAVLTNLSGASTDKTATTFRMSAPPYGGVEGQKNIVERASDVKYSLPISFGIQTQIDVSDNIRVGVGINYTLLKSKYDCLINKKFYNIHQTIHYIGVPVNFYFNIVNNNNFYVYANLGGSIEKGLRINYNYKSYDGAYSRGESISGMQYSVNAGIGIEYVLSKNIGIYIEPNAAYYFKSDIPASIRTDQPFQIKAELGVRYHFGR